MSHSDSPLRRASDAPEADRVPPLTEAQLQLFSEQTRRATHKAVRIYRNQAAAGFLILALGTGVAFKREDTDRTSARATANEQRQSIVRSGQAVSVDGCNRDFRTISGLRGLLVSARKINENAAAKGAISKEQLQQATDFYNAQLKVIVQPDCRLAARLLTSKPHAKIAVPKPLYNKKKG